MKFFFVRTKNAAMVLLFAKTYFIWTLDTFDSWDESKLYEIAPIVTQCTIDQIFSLKKFRRFANIRKSKTDTRLISVQKLFHAMAIPQLECKSDESAEFHYMQNRTYFDTFVSL